MNKIRLAILFGGKSPEHDVSIMSCASVLNHIDKNSYVINVIGISREGDWRHIEEINIINYDSLKLSLQRGHTVSLSEVVNFFITSIDVVFPLLHGPFGEDGTIQGFFETLNIPYVGAGVASSVMCMDKAYMKTVLAAEKIPMTPFIIIRENDNRAESINEICKKLAFPLYVKPANLGSSVGISKVIDKPDLLAAIDKAFEYDQKIVIEQGVRCREIECGVLGNNPFIVGCVGEIVASHEFYDYESKYFDEGRSRMIVPAKLSESNHQIIQYYSLRIAELLDVKGLSRIDFFIDLDTDIILFNEINTMPGFTAYSMYPSLYRNIGIEYPVLIDYLIDFAIKR